MSIYKRGDIWWVKFTGPDGKEVRRSAGTSDREKAQEWHDKLKAQLWDQKRLGVKPRRSWKEAIIRFVEERDNRPNTLDNDLSNARVMDRFLGHLDLQDITLDTLDGIVAALRKLGNKPGTINARMAFVGSILRRASREWEWIDKAPSVRRLSGSTKRVRWLTRDEADRLIDELPEWLASQARFTLATGLRASNVRNLQWKDVDLERRICWVSADDSKGKRAIGVPLNNDAVVVLREQHGNHPTLVFSKDGVRSPEQGCKAFRRALIRAGIHDFRWHDLRHTWASWHCQNGTPLNDLRELGGWSKFETVLIYSHMAPDHLASSASNIETLRVQGKRIAK